MSIHKSLIPPSKLKRHRNVLSRDERLAKLIGEGKWDENKSVFGLPKLRNIMLKAKPKPKKEAAAAGAAAAPGTAAGAAPAVEAGKKGAPQAGADKKAAGGDKKPAGDKKAAK